MQSPTRVGTTDNGSNARIAEPKSFDNEPTCNRNHLRLGRNLLKSCDLFVIVIQGATLEVVWGKKTNMGVMSVN
jgi:hypothetical protein